MAWTGAPGSVLAEDNRIAPLFLIDVSDVADRDSLIVIAVAIAYSPGHALWVECIFPAKTVAHLALKGVLIAALD